MRAVLVDLQWTDLRHTFAKRLEMVGVNATTIADLLGHIGASLAAHTGLVTGPRSCGQARDCLMLIAGRQFAMKAWASGSKARR